MKKEAKKARNEEYTGKNRGRPQNTPTKHGEVPVENNTTPSYSMIEQSQFQHNTEVYNGGLVRQPYINGAGASNFEWVFAGNARKAQDGGVWSDTCDAEANPKLSLGSNNIAIEAKLRRRKTKLNFKEPERRGGIRHRRGR